jgi:hypothetical protein
MEALVFALIIVGIIGWYKWDTAWSPKAAENRERIKKYAAATHHCKTIIDDNSMIIDDDSVIGSEAMFKAQFGFEPYATFYGHGDSND